MRFSLGRLIGVSVFTGCALSHPRGGAQPPSAESQEAPTVDEVAAQIDALYSPLLQPDAPGAVVAVFVGGEPWLVKCFGLANVETGDPITPATNFRLASITKQVTATCIMMLRGEGALSLDDPIGRFLPELGPLGARITIRHLLTHTSGIIAYEDIMPPDQQDQLSDADVLALVMGRPETYFEPGTRYRYSNTGYALLALIVERASGERFADFLRAHIFEPLGMANAVAYERGRSVVAHRAYGHKERGGRWVIADQSLTSAVLGDGGIYCSADDYLRWDEALYTDRLLPQAALEEMWTPNRLADGTPTHYGYGWEIDTRHGERVIYHNGGTIGFSNAVRRVPGRHMTLLVLSNRDNPAARSKADDLLDWILMRSAIAAPAR